MTSDRQDPDPATIGFGLVSVISLTIQLRDKYRARRGTAAPPLSSNAAERQQVVALQKAAREVSTALDDVIRAVTWEDDGSDGLSAPLSIGGGSILLSKVAGQEYGQALGAFYGATAQLALWINHIIFENPALADRIGKQLDTPLGSVADEVNGIVRNARSVEDVVRQARLTLQALQHAVGVTLQNR